MNTNSTFYRKRMALCNHNAAVSELVQLSIAIYIQICCKKVSFLLSELEFFVLLSGFAAVCRFFSFL